MLKRFREASWRVASRSRIRISGLRSTELNRKIYIVNRKTKNRRPRPLEIPREFLAEADRRLLRWLLGVPLTGGLVVT